jgi:putative DNA primase/helicase
MVEGGSMMDFVSFARAHGVDIRQLSQGDRVFRCPTVSKPNSDNGAYYFDGQRGWVWNWEEGGGTQWWQDESAKPWTANEKAEWARRRQAADRAKAEARQLAAKRAAEMIKSARLDVHQYLELKGHSTTKALVTEAGEMLIPMRSETGALLGLQVISLTEDRQRWQKKMIYGMQAKGARLLIGSKSATELCLVEGYSTGLSVDIALRLLKLPTAVMVCFSAGNLVHIAKQLTGRVFIYADNDESQTGLKAAQEAGLPFCMSDVVGNDANDDHRAFGVMAVAQKIQEARRKL